MAAKLRGGSREEGMRKVWRELEFASRKGRDFSVHLKEKWRAVLCGLLLSEILTDFGLG